MTYCINPDCPEPHCPDLQTDITLACPVCGSALRLHDRYSALQLLGQSALERTFLAIDHQLAPDYKAEQDSNMKCVIKQFLPQVASKEGQAIALFQQGVQRLQDLAEDPQLPRLIDAFEQAGRFYLVHEFVAGQNLAAVLHKRGAFGEAQIWQLLTELLPLLHFIHQHQVIHRDIKPENIIQTSESRTPGNHFVLVDFGVAIRGSIAEAATPLGSPEYAAPEQTRGKATYASDLYSLGVTCIHLLTEVSPFDLYDSLSDRWIWRSCLPQPVSDRLAQVLDKLIQNAVSLRFQTTAQVIQESGIRSQVASSKADVLKSRAPLDFRLAPGAVNAIALCPAMQILASAGDDKPLCLWDLTAQQRPIMLPGKGVRSLLFADSMTLISAGDDKAIRLWDNRSGQLITTLIGHKASVRSLALSPDGQILASASWDKTVRLWDWRSGELMQVLQHGLQATAVAFSPDGEWIASASCDRMARLWRRAKPDQPIVLSGHTWAVLTVAFSPDSQTLATGSEDNSVKLWEVQTGRLIQTLTGHSWAIAALAFSPDGKTLLSASWDKTIKLWDVTSGSLQTTLIGHTDSVNAIAVRPLTSATAYEIFSGGRDKFIYRWQKS